MFIIKRSGERESVHFDKITTRLQSLCFNLSPRVDPAIIAQKVIQRLKSGMSTVDLDHLSSKVAANMCVDHPDYAILAGRIEVSNLHKQTDPSFVAVMEQIYKENDNLISDASIALVREHGTTLDGVINHERSFDYNYFGFKTLEKSYLIKDRNGEVIERPQHMLMRTAVQVNVTPAGFDLDGCLETYRLMSMGYYTHATPTLFNSLSTRSQCSSCFLVGTDDCIGIEEDGRHVGIFKTMSDVANISKWSGGVGIHISNIRAKGTIIKGTNGRSDGIVPMLKVYNDIACYINQGGKRKGSFAIYLEPWHGDVLDFLDLKKNTGDEKLRTRDLHLAMWIPDLFMRRVESDGMWSLMCPHECPGLADTYGDEFDSLYLKYETEGRYKRQVKAHDVWFKILEAQMETGEPYILFKDSVNRKSNQKNIGVIRGSNLCVEILEYSDKDETAVCNLSSIALPKFVNGSEFDYDSLFEVAKRVALNTDRVIDINFYPTPETKRSNMRHRPIGVGVQGLADVYAKMRIPFDSAEAREVNRRIFETIYFACLTQSCTTAITEGEYSTFKGSPLSEGLFQWELWGLKESDLSGLWDWGNLRTQILKFGVRNSLMVALMPTASTAQILGNNEAFEPFTNNIYKRRVLSGEFIVMNNYLIRDLIRLDLWSPEMKNRIVNAYGSVQDIEVIPAEIKRLYKTVWEMKQKVLIDQSLERGPFVDQAQSLNLWMAEPTFGKLSSMHFYSWRKGAKNGIYYLRTRPAMEALRVTAMETQSESSYGVCSMDEGCLVCSS